MASLYLESGTTSPVTPPLSYSLLGFNVGVTQVTQSIVIDAEKPFLYYNKRFLSALNSGLISQAIYDNIINNQNEARQLFEIESNLDINKQLLIDLVDKFLIPNVNSGGTAAEIVEDIINEGYQIIKKI